MKNLLWSLMLVASLAHAGPDELVMAIPLDQVMPLAEFKGKQVTGGIMKDISEALVARLGRKARLLTMPGDKVGQALQRGEADGTCRVLPTWIDGDFHWTAGFIPDGEMVAARIDAPPITSINSLRDVPVGTVATFRYPRIAQVLGSHFRREEAPSLELNIQKLAAGKLQYVLVGQYELLYHQHTNREPKLRSDLKFAAYNTHCAFARSAPVTPVDIDSAVNAMISDGTVEKILARYR